MLKDRRVLVEDELKNAKTQAAKMYFEMVTRCELTSKNHEYQDLRDFITDLEFDLSVINELIASGHE